MVNRSIFFAILGTVMVFAVSFVAFIFLIGTRVKMTFDSSSLALTFGITLSGMLLVTIVTADVAKKIIAKRKLGSILSELSSDDLRHFRTIVSSTPFPAFVGDSVNGGKQSIVLPDGTTLDVNIPPGTRDGQILRLKGKGRPALGGGPPGDALIEISVLPHPYFTRKGDDIYLDLPISLKEAVLGLVWFTNSTVSVEEVFTAYKKRGFNHEGRMACVHC